MSMTAGRIKVGRRARRSSAIRELIDYSRYAMQLQPFLDAYGFDHVCPFSSRGW